MPKYILVIIFCLMSSYVFSQSEAPKYKLVVRLNNAPFRSLALLDYRDSHNLIIRGKSLEQFKWEFTLSDSTVSNLETMMLIVPDKDTVTNAFRQIRFKRKFENKTTTTVNIGIQDEVNFIEGEYIGRTQYENENVSDFLGIIDSVIIGNLICDDFNLLIADDNSDIAVRSNDAYYAWFDKGDNNYSYENHLQSYLDLAKKYPDSRYLMTNLALNWIRFKTKKDVKDIYLTLSEKQKQTKWSKIIERFLSGNYENLLLENLDTKQTELIVQDSSKYNLVIFSASWCAPCIEEMPLLKKLYKDLKQDITFTFVSMDNKKNIQKFQSLLNKNNILWRTLYAYKDLERITDLFSVRSIPYSLLISPKGQTEVLDVRKIVNQKKLYEIYNYRLQKKL